MKASLKIQGYDLFYAYKNGLFSYLYIFCEICSSFLFVIKMSLRIEPSFIIRELKLDDCEEVRNIWTEGLFAMAKYNNELMTKIYPKAFFVAQDIETGK
jgi:hypothetical protein